MIVINCGGEWHEWCMDWWCICLDEFGCEYNKIKLWMQLWN